MVSADGLEYEQKTSMVRQAMVVSRLLLLILNYLESERSLDPARHSRIGEGGGRAASKVPFGGIIGLSSPECCF
jgi:hypothetical protein